MSDSDDISISEMQEVVVLTPHLERRTDEDVDSPPPADPEESFHANPSLVRIEQVKIELISCSGCTSNLPRD